MKLKKFISLFLILSMLLFVSIIQVSAESVAKSLDDLYYDYCAQLNDLSDKPVISRRVVIDGITYFEGYQRKHPLQDLEKIGGFNFFSDWYMLPDTLGLYAYDGSKIYDFETAYNMGIATDIEKVAQWHSPEFNNSVMADMWKKFGTYAWEKFENDVAGGNTKIPSYIEIDGLTYFIGDSVLGSFGGEVSKEIGGYSFYSERTNTPYDLGIYVYDNGEVSDLETAYTNGIVTNIQAVAEFYADYTAVEDAFLQFAKRELAYTNIPEKPDVAIKNATLIDGLTYFEGYTWKDIEYPHFMDFIQVVGGCSFYSNYSHHIDNLGIYVYDGSQVYTLENAYNLGLISDISKIAQWHSPDFNDEDGKSDVTIVDDFKEYYTNYYGVTNSTKANYMIYINSQTEIDGVTYFGGHGWVEPVPMEEVTEISGYKFRTGISYPYHMGLYVYNSEKVYEFETAYEMGMITDIEKVAMWHSPNENKTVVEVTAPKSTVVKKLTAKKHKVTVKWKKQKKDVMGYKIQYSTKADFKNSKSKNIKDKDKTTFVLKNLNSKTKYFVRIKTYKIVDGKKYFSAWSEAKKVKTK